MQCTLIHRAFCTFYGQFHNPKEVTAVAPTFETRQWEEDSNQSLLAILKRSYIVGQEVYKLLSLRLRVEMKDETTCQEHFKIPGHGTEGTASLLAASSLYSVTEQYTPVSGCQSIIWFTGGWAKTPSRWILHVIWMRIRGEKKTKGRTILYSYKPNYKRRNVTEQTGTVWPETGDFRENVKEEPINTCLQFLYVERKITKLRNANNHNSSPQTPGKLPDLIR